MSNRIPLYDYLVRYAASERTLGEGPLQAIVTAYTPEEAKTKGAVRLNCRESEVIVSPHRKTELAEKEWFTG